jgi:hypothetical protein
MAIFLAMSEEPLAASATLRAISFVVAVCSSTADAIVFWMSLIRSIAAVISVIACIAPLVSL